MKITFLTTIVAMLLALPVFGFSLGDLLNLQKKSDESQNPVSASESASASDSASDAAVSESAISGQTQTNQGGSEARNPDSPSNARATGGGCKKNKQGEIVC